MELAISTPAPVFFPRCEKNEMPPIELITAPPAHISPAEHRQLVASTPSSFNDIPPVLRHKEENIAVSFEPALSGFSSEDGSKGTLYVTESVLAFVSNTGKGFQVNYPTVTLHAISRTEAGPSVYCQLDETIQDQNGQTVDADADALHDMRELKLIPTDPASLEPIFEAMSICAALHPDPQESDDDMDDAFADASGDFETFTGDEAQELSEVGRASLAYLESIIDDPHHRLPQAEGEEEGESVKDSEAKINGAS